jgi:hypothetical protein
MFFKKPADAGGVFAGIFLAWGCLDNSLLKTIAHLGKWKIHRN